MKSLTIRFLCVGLLINLAAALVPANPPQGPSKPSQAAPKAAAKIADLQTEAIKIGYVKNEELVDMCGCTFADSKGVRFAGDTGGAAWMNIDGEDIKLTFKSSRGPKIERIGSRYTETFEADGIQVFLVLIVNRLCRPYSSECETTGFTVTITVKKAGRQARAKARGQCGCL